MNFPEFKELTDAALRALPLALLIVLGAVTLRAFIRRAFDLLARRTHLRSADLRPFRRVLNSLLYAITAVLLLTVFGVNLGGLWAVFTTILAMVAIGFVAVWSLLSNISCTLIILFFRPFAIGDDIEFTGEPVKGRVVDLNFLYTTLRAEDGSLVQIPNNMFFQKSMKRRPGQGSVTLAHQLNSSTPADA